MADEQRSRLGRGLAALIGEMEPQAAPAARSGAGRGGPRRVPIEHVRPNPRNPRRTFLEEGLEDLTASIREKGIIQPIVVRQLNGSDSFEIVAGERRWRAAQRAALHEVPVVVLELSDREALEVAIIENVQRADLNPVEEAQGYESLMGEFDYNQNDLARIIGKSRSHIANTLRLLKLPAGVKTYLADGRLSAGHARALLACADPERMAKDVVEKGLTVRDVEALSKARTALTAAPVKGQVAPTGKASKGGAPERKSADSRALEKRLGDVLGLSVDIEGKGEAGELRIRYKSLDQLDEVCRRLGLD
ncbi:ParB/RepB/Spo0J family partition protein [Xanthobacter oligotrophicus]|uniref:ParB/RepB/Spo0J family partition protein n=1 Tax=Xanthobacter oligotrophicus TaxID=2607286 RepID=UPI0011F37BAA|nr:ParB/RepB/Spo0J family partition protein [Xanthobacter oligotrophicus]MCG5237654.1 ParB/RepB/Spo0J family partition protein [Xanthobacter oligotrophicus]